MLIIMLGEESYRILCEAREERKQEQNFQIEKDKKKGKIKQLIKKIINKR